MKVVDANVLINAVNAEATDHHLAVRWLDDALTRRLAVGFAWSVIVAFLRVSTRPGQFARPLTFDQAWDQVDDWLGATSASVLTPTVRHPQVMRDLLRPMGRVGTLADDAHLAALAVEHRGEVVTFDSDFARFAGVRWERPA